MATSTHYFDYAAATPLDAAVLAAMQPYFSEQFFNPSATYLQAVGVHKDLEAARGTVAELLGARPSEVTFTAGGTEANNLAVHGVMSQYPDANMVTTPIEHESVLEPARQYEVREVAVGADGIVSEATIIEQIDDQTALISVMYANNEIGSIQPIRKIALELEMIKKDRKKRGIDVPLLFHTDAAQAGNYLDLHVARLGVDLLTLNGGKIYGPKQSGVLYVRGGVVLKPLYQGGGQESGLRSGTENVAGAIGFAAALVQAQALRHEEVARLKALQSDFFKQLAQRVPDAIVNGSTSNRLPNNLHVTFPGIDNERLLIQLEEQGILAAAGSACSASKEEASHVLLALGMSEADARGSIRFTMGRQTVAKDVEKLLEILPKLLS